MKMANAAKFIGTEIAAARRRPEVKKAILIGAGGAFFQIATTVFLGPSIERNLVVSAIAAAASIAVLWVGRTALSVTLAHLWAFLHARLQKRRAAGATREKAMPKGFLIDWLMPPDRAEDVLYNLLGRYPLWATKHGEQKAKLIFMTQSIGSIVTFWSDWLLQRVRLLNLLRPFS